MATINEIHQQLNSMLASLDEREQAIAQAAEMLTESAAVQAALHQGATSMLDRVLMLIDHQLGQLNRGGTNALVLETLRRTVLEVEA